MICYSKKLKNFKPKKRELEPFDLQKINRLKKVHPFFLLWKKFTIIVLIMENIL